MDVEALASLDSQVRFCQDLVEKVTTQECFILLSGESGSGRTVACEHVVNETDSKMRAVFIPCNQDMQLQRLRELFLQQLLPNTEFDIRLNLADALAHIQIPHNQKILVVVDDVDSVIVSFFKELLALYEQFLGQDRFAFVLVCHPMWAEEKIRSYMGKAHLTQVQIPALNLKESLVLSRHIFALQNTMRIYNAIVNELPAALAPAKGNLSQIIKITENLMKEPTAALKTGTDKGQFQSAPAPAVKKKKSSSVGIFVSVVCIIIVLACLIPILFGGNFFSSSTSDTTVAQGANDEGLVFNESQYAVDDGVLPPKVPTGLDAPTHDTGTEHSVTLSGEELDRIEGGAHSSGYPRGVDGSVKSQPQAAPQFPVQPNVAATQDPLKSNTAATNAAALAAGLTEEDVDVPEVLPVLERGRNLNHPITQRAAPPDISEQVQKANALAEAEERARLEAAAKAKLEADRKLAAQVQKDAQAKAAEQKKPETSTAQNTASANRETPRETPRPAQTQRPALKAGQIINLADEQRQLEEQRRQTTRQPQPYVPDASPAASGNAFEGKVSEISQIANSHYTVQIVSASNRANISAAARGLNGKYWIFETRRNGRPWYVLCAGDYASRNEAMQAAANIPSSVSQGASPFAKSIADLKAEFRL